MNIDGWEYDFPKLKYWYIRENMPYVTDTLFESPNGKVACLLYSIAEVRALDYRGFMALFTDKNEPELLLAADYINFYKFAFLI